MAIAVVVPAIPIRRPQLLIRQVSTAEIMTLVIGVILLLGGLFGMTLTASIANFVIGKFNETGVTVPASYNYFATTAPVLSVVALLLGIVLIVVAAVFMIRHLMGGFRGLA